MKLLPGLNLSFSKNRALGVTKLKRSIAKSTGIPTTKRGLERKVGANVLGFAAGRGFSKGGNSMYGFWFFLMQIAVMLFLYVAYYVVYYVIWFCYGLLGLIIVQSFKWIKIKVQDNFSGRILNSRSKIKYKF